jgi:quercetin dioxygenase-like cupin family protein
MMSRYAAVVLVTCCVLLYGGDLRAADPGNDTSKPTTVANLMTRDLDGIPGKEGVMLTVEYGPGAKSLPHRHDASVFVYVLAGSVVMQVKGQEKLTLHAGQTFYEGPNDIHLVSANGSSSQPAKILVFIVKDKGAPITLPATGDQH